jgi:hypothetical protein
VNRRHEETQVMAGSVGPAGWRPQQPQSAPWQGRFAPFAVGDPGRAAGSVQPAPDPEQWDRRDTVLDGVAIRDTQDREVVQLRAASVRGLSHRYYGKVRQDDYAFRLTSDRRYLVAAVADGVSAGRYSQYAAAVVTTLGCHILADRLHDDRPEDLDWTGLLHRLSAAVVDKGRALLRQRHPEVDLDGLSTRDLAGYLAATALFAVLELPFDGAEMTAHVLPYGDTSAWVLRANRGWENLQPIKNQGVAIASSGTRAIPLVPREADLPVTTSLHPGDALALVTDGIGDPLGNGGGDVGAFLSTVWRRPPPALEFAAHVDFARKSFDDDRTAVVFWPQPDR